MSGLTCYKCGSPDELSIKTRRRNGSVQSMICRTCRRVAMSAYKATRLPLEPTQTLTDQEEWEIRAKESHDRILRRFAV